jgi:hypothetical protein
VPNGSASVSRALNKVLFGASVVSGADFNKQLEVVSLAYAANFLLIFITVALICTVFGYYDPLHSPLAASNIRMPAGLSNLMTFTSMYLASRSWVLREQSPEGLRRRHRLRYVRYFGLAGIVSFSFFFTAVTFLMPHWTVLLATWFSNSVLLLALLQGRALRNRKAAAA